MLDMIAHRFAIALALALLPLIASAQQGDKKGEVQQSRIPKEKIPPSPPLAPGDALKRFSLQPGYRIELVASEPMIQVPTILQFDPAGRLWVAEMRNFMATPEGVGETNPVGRISILEDTDDDGRADRHKVFLDGLVMPRAFLLVNGGALVCEPPKLWFYPIANDRPGERVLVAADFAKDADPTLGVRMNPEHSGNSLLLAMDNWIYSLYHPWRYRFTDGKWLREPVPQRAQWGLSQDDFGRLYYTSNSDQLRGDMVPPHYFGAKVKAKLPGIGYAVAKDQTVWPGRINPGVNRGYQTGTLREDGRLAKFTAACGSTIYRGELFPDDARGNAFVCEPSGNFIRRNVLSEIDGAVSARNAYDEAEFLTSTDELFRPVNLATGPDGALYVADMYHGIIQHRFFLTSYLRQQAQDRGIHKVTDHGRVWRITPAGKAPARVPNLATMNSAALVGELAHPNGWRRDTAQRLLVERRDPSVVPALQALATSKAAAPANAVTRLQALWTLEGLNALDEATVLAAMADTHPKVRAVGMRLTESLAKSAPASAAGLAEKLLAMSSDTSSEVQMQLALSLSLLAPSEKTKAAAASLAKISTGAIAKDIAAYTVTVLDPPKPDTKPVAKARALTAAEQKQFEAGKMMYEATCLACHQIHGMGQPGLAPPLVGSEWIGFSENRLIRMVIHGLRGPITVKGEKFEMDMPALGVLDDEQIASVLTYIRREWGHGFEPVTPAAVKRVRDETSKREDAWTMPELLKIP